MIHCECTNDGLLETVDMSQFPDRFSKSRSQRKSLESITDGVLETAVSAGDSLVTGFSMSRSRLVLEENITEMYRMYASVKELRRSILAHSETQAALQQL
jgi:hypothetical protein